MKEDIINSVRTILSEDYKLHDIVIRPESSLRNDCGLDSLDVMEIVMKLETQYNIHVPYSESDDIDTVQDIIDVISSHLDGK